MKYPGKRILIILACFVPVSSGVMAQQVGYSHATGNVQGRNHVGGLIGGVAGELTGDLALIRDSYAKGSVSGNTHIGGFVGSNAATIERSYATGPVSGDAHTGGFAGSNTGTITHSYWNTQTSGQSASAGGEGRNTSAMTHPHSSNTFVGWDFSTVWQSDASPAQNNGYPRLRHSPMYELSLRVYPPGAGTVSGSGTYRANQQAEIAAMAHGDYLFTGWSHQGSIISTQSGMQLHLSGHTTLTAHFEKQATSTGFELAEPLRLRVYPNPARDRLVVELPAQGETLKSVSLVNFIGQTVLTIIPDTPTQTRITLPVDQLKPGVYLIVATLETTHAVEKIVIQ